jgi:hypothetical protein
VQVIHPFARINAIGINCTGGLLVSLYHKLEKRMTHVIVEKNKKIRLAAAKETFSKLEGEHRQLDNNGLLLPLPDCLAAGTAYSRQ